MSFSDSVWEKLQSEKNVSRTINAAVEFYFASKDYLKNQENDFILKELAKYIPHEKRRPVPNRAIFEPDLFD